jgi:Flp pilus assembly protein TadG
MSSILSSKSQARERGIAMLEFTIALPFLLLLMLSIAELGRAFVQYSMLTNAVRNAARYVASQALNGSTGVVSISSQLSTQGKNLVAYGSIAGSTAMLPGISPNQVSITSPAGSGNVSVSISYPYTSLLGSTLPTFGLSRTSTSLVFYMAAATTLRALP